MHRFRPLFASLVLAFGSVLPVAASLNGLAAPVGPHGYPLWYRDSTGLQLELALLASATGQNGLGNPIPVGTSTRPDLIIFDPINPANPNSVQLGVGDESFWWMADSTLNLPTGGRAILVLGLEAAFGGPGSPANGQQIAFGRVRVRVDTPVAGTYRITYPYGRRVFTGVPAGTNGINETFDIGAINQLDTAAGFSGALAAEIGPFLTWPDYQNEPTLKVVQLDGLGVPVVPEVVLEQYVGNPGVPHIVTGAINGNENVFRIEREAPTGSGNFVLLAESVLFQVMGKVWNGAAGAAHTFPPPPQPNLFAVGPVNREVSIDVPLPSGAPDALRPDGLLVGPNNEALNYPVGYPTYFQEAIVTPGVPPALDVRAGGVKLTYMPAFDPMGITAPVSSVPLRAGDEGFFWSSEAFINADTTDVANLPNGLDGILVLALEGAFSSGAPEAGKQMVFGRVRVRVDVPVAGAYTITHPYGVEEFSDVTTADGINMTRDIMVTDPAKPDQSFVGALFSDIGPLFLKWHDPLVLGYDFMTDTALQRPSDPLNASSPVVHYVGDPTIPHTVTGSPNSTNFFRIQGPNGIDVTTALFNVSGKVYDPATFNLAADPSAPVTNPDTASVNLAQANSVDINVRANDVISPNATATTTAIVVGPTGGTAVVDADGSIIYTSGAALVAGGTDTFSYRLTSTVGVNNLVSNTSDVTVTVQPVESITFTQARLDSRRLRLELAGASNFPGSTLTFYRGAAATGTPLGTAQVGANGRWTFRATLRTNLTQVTVRSNVAFPVTVTRTLQLR